MDDLFHKGIDWFVKMMQISTSFSNCVEISTAKLQFNQVSSLYIVSNDVDIVISFCDDSSNYTVIAPPDTDSCVVKVNQIFTDDCCKIIIEKNMDVESLLPIKVRFKLPYCFNSVTLISDSGDIELKNCKSSNACISTASGDIVVNNHIFPCFVVAQSTNGDVIQTNSRCVSKANSLTCKSVDGDIMIRNFRQE